MSNNRGAVAQRALAACTARVMAHIMRQKKQMAEPAPIAATICGCPSNQPSAKGGHATSPTSGRRVKSKAARDVGGVGWGSGHAQPQSAARRASALAFAFSIPNISPLLESFLVIVI